MFIADTACSGKSVRSGRESAMKLKFNGVTKLTTLLTVVASICVDAAQAHATQKQRPRQSLLLRFCRPQRILSIRTTYPNLHNQALMAGCWRRGPSGRSQVH